MIRGLFVLCFLMAFSSGCGTKTPQQSEDARQTISAAEGTDSASDTLHRPTPKPSALGIGDSIVLRDVLYQVTDCEQLSDSSGIVRHLPKADSTTWVAVKVRCRNEGILHAGPSSGTLEIALGDDTLSYPTILFRTDWRETSLQPGETGNFTSVYKVPKNSNGKWFWKLGGKNAGASMRFLLK